LRAAGGVVAAAVLTDLDFFLLGAISKFSEQSFSSESRDPH
jgi:hypothetical protein